MDRLIARIGEVGRVQAEREWEVARAHAVQEAVREHPGTVLALGAGHTVLTSPEHSTTVHRALASCALVVLLLPREDRDEALTELRRRSLADKGTAWISDGHDFLAEWLDSPSNRTLATLTFVSAERTIAETARELAALIPPGQAVRPPQ